MRELSLHILDLMQNSLEAGAGSIKLIIKAQKHEDIIGISIIDNGSGIKPDMLTNVTDPFVTTRKTRPVGLGLALFKEQCELTGGDLKIASEPGKGTSLEGRLVISSIDRLPLGLLDETVAVVAMAKPDLDLELILECGTACFRLSLNEVRDKLGDVPVNEPAVILWLRSLIKEQQELIFGGVLNEIISRT